MVTNNQSNNNYGKYLLIIAFAVLLLLSVMYVSSATTVSSSDLEDKTCTKCHEMRPQYYTWQVSSHRQIPCRKCHPDSSLIWMFLSSRAGKERGVITATNFIKNDVCLECHTTERNVTPPNGLFSAHTLHISKDLDCVACHRDVAHAQVVPKMLETGEKTFETFTMDDAKKLVAGGNRVPMKTCMRCHNGTKAPSNCAACHENKPIPITHNTVDWKTKHGGIAYKDLKGCNFCHEYDVAKQQAANVANNNYLSLQQYARTNDFCRSCHAKRPPGHSDFYSVEHNKYAKQSKEYCLVCHDWTPGKITPAPVAKVVCTSCHVQSTHPANWVNIHKNSAKSTAAQSCFSCHDQQSCTNCHTAKGVNTN